MPPCPGRFLDFKDPAIAAEASAHLHYRDESVRVRSIEARHAQEAHMQDSFESRALYPILRMRLETTLHLSGFFARDQLVPGGNRELCLPAMALPIRRDKRVH